MDEWNVVWEGNLASAEANPGGGAGTGFLGIYCYPHSADPGTDYATNLSEGSALAYADTDDFSEDLASETSFDFVVKARWNRTHAYNVDQFDDSRCRVNLTATSSDWAVGSSISDVTGTLVVTSNESDGDFIWAQIYWNNAGSGYQLADDGTITVSEISIEAKY